MNDQCQCTLCTRHTRGEGVLFRGELVREIILLCVVALDENVLKRQQYSHILNNIVCFRYLDTHVVCSIGGRQLPKSAVSTPLYLATTHNALNHTTPSVSSPRHGSAQSLPAAARARACLLSCHSIVTYPLYQHRFTTQHTTPSTHKTTLAFFGDS